MSRQYPRAVPKEDEERARLIEASARAGVHLSDQFRADAAKIDWDAMHIRAGRRPALDLPDRPKRSWASWDRR